MHSSPPSLTASAIGYPFHALLAAFPFAGFTLALLTDIAYWQTSNLMWHNFSAWLLLAGLVFGGFALLAGLLEFFFKFGNQENGMPGRYVAGGILVLFLAVLNSFVHAGDGWTAIVPWGLTLSAVTFILMAITAWLGRAAAYRLSAGGVYYD